MVRIDAHQHFWNPARGDYGWMPKDDPILSRTYGPQDLATARKAAGITHTVLVQAAPTVNETEYMLGVADTAPEVAGVVGWIDFEDPTDATTLARLASHPKFLGVRPMIQNIEDDDWMLRDDIQWAFKALVDQGLTFDALGFPRHLANFLTILKRYPDLNCVVDHCMKPRIAAHSSASFEAWADGMRRIASETSACCKLSGLVTEARPDWTVEALRPYANHVLEVFGADRVMWGSDWPVCRLRSEYEDWHSAALTLTESLSDAERDAVFGGNAARFYGLEV